MKNILVFTFLFVATLATYSQATWNIDRSHSNVRFTVTHLVISEVEGNFKNFEGTISASKPDFTDAVINFTVDVNSINTDNEMRDNHLKNDDFFNAEKYPKMTFKSTSFKQLKGNKYELIGLLTIRDVTKTVKWNVTYGGTTNDPWGNTKAGFKASTEINRLDYGLKWNSLTEAGGAVVGSEVTIDLRLEFAKSK